MVIHYVFIGYIYIGVPGETFIVILFYYSASKPLAILDYNYNTRLP